MKGRRVHTTQYESNGLADWRIIFIMCSFLLLFLVVLFRLYALQVSGFPLYDAMAHDQHMGSSQLLPRRGEIYLHNGTGEHFPLAVNKQSFTVYVSPKEVEDIAHAQEVLARHLGGEKEAYEKYFVHSDDPFEIVQKRVEGSVIDALRLEEVDGIHVLEEPYRYYPGESLASQVVGFVGSDGERLSGRYGVEASWEEELRGKVGSIHQERDARGRWIAITDREYDPERDGSDLVLTIDAGVQFEVERLLGESREQHNADSASAVVLEVGTGRILAMANVPDFNPNTYSEVEDMTHYLNPVISHVYEVGSVFKPITMAIGIDAGKITPESTYVDTGVIHEAGYEIMNSDEKAYGKQTMTQVLEESLNTGMIHVERLIGNKDFREYIERFGFGERSGIALPSESYGSLSNLEYLNRDINFYTASFGQGISMTLLQLAMSYDVLANGGALMKPHIIDSIIESDGAVRTFEKEMVRRVIGEETSRDIGEMLYSVVENGHGKRAGVEGYRVGGKTGTAQVAKSDEKGYSEEESIGSFAGFAPIGNPQFVVAVKVRNPKDVIWAESTAAPLFGGIMKFLLDYYQIEPTEPLEDNENV